jgi:hypothetical protein
MNRDRELIDTYKDLFRRHFNSPNLGEVDGTWFFFEKTGRVSFVSQEREEYLNGAVPATAWFRMKGWTVTPLVIHKILADR